MQQQQDCKADVGVGDALLGGGKSGRMTMLGSLARIEMEAMEGVRRCNDRAFSSRRTNRLQARVGKDTGSQKVERLRTNQQAANEDQKTREKTASLAKIIRHIPLMRITQSINHLSFLA